MKTIDQSLAILESIFLDINFPLILMIMTGILLLLLLVFILMEKYLPEEHAFFAVRSDNETDEKPRI